MATPNSHAWSAASPQPAGGDDYGLQARPMGLKVHYTFDRDNQIHCLARWPHIIQIQSMPFDDRTTIGVVDLRTVLQAVAQCSPEIVNQHDNDYSVYATDYSEPDWPLVGQGMLSWGLDQNNNDQQQPQMVTGRVTRNMMALLGNGSRETLEVKLKLTAVVKMPERSDFSSLESLSLARFTPPDPSSEWNSFLQSNPMLGHSANVASMPSPALPPAQLNQPNGQSQNSMNDTRYMDTRHDSAPPQPSRPASIPPANAMPPTSLPPTNMSLAPARPLAPTDNVPSPVGGSQPMDVSADKSARPSRPSSRASRSRAPTGRPRGRPRKKPLDTGSTSAAEEATDGDEGPQRKRAKVTQGEYSLIAPFGSAPDSLRVAASTSGSLRNMRPIGVGADNHTANHLQDVPRAPTPVPDVPFLQRQQQRMRFVENKPRSESLGDLDCPPVYQPQSVYQTQQGQLATQIAMNQDARSPTESVAQSPDQVYTPEDSPEDLGSSPPVPRTSVYIQSSPPASSPILPAMPMPQVDSGFMSGGIDDYFDDDELVQELPRTKEHDLPTQRQGQAPSAPPPQPASKPNIKKPSRSQQQKPPNFPFHEVNPGPPELLPTTSIFNPAGKAKTLNRPPALNVSGLKKPANRSFKRSNTAPNSVIPQQTPRLQEQSASQQPEASMLGPHDRQHQQLEQPAAPHDESVHSSIVTVLQEALKSEVGNEANSIPRSESGAPIADMVPVPERPMTTEPVLTLPTQPSSKPASRPASRGPSAPPVPESDPIAELPAPSRSFMSEPGGPPSDSEPPRYSKNQVKKQSIKERLETAIQKGEQPPFCNNCGAIETPTWRKIWTQDHHGVPGFHEFSDKPGCVTTVDVLERDSKGLPSAYRLIKKHLGPTEDKKLWKESLLCNPCGIWLAKFKCHRPPDRWEKDAARLGQPRRKRENKNGNGRSKKSRSKSDAQMNPTSEAYFTTDPIGPGDQDSPKRGHEFSHPPGHQNNAILDNDNEKNQSLQSIILNLRSSSEQRGPGSTHSRGSGTADSPIAVEDDLGTTRRILFPSPRKDGVPKVLGELNVNLIQTNTNFQEPKSASAGKENANLNSDRSDTPTPGNHDDLEQELFGTPPNRPSTPPLKSASSGVFKTPTRPTPSHRPITRSISRSIRSVRTIPKSPGQAFNQLLRTPSKTPRSSGGSNIMMLSTGRRRSPRNGGLHTHFALLDEEMGHNHSTVHFDSPFTTTLNQLLSEANDFTAGSPSHGLVDLDLISLPNLDSDAVSQHLANANALDFGNFLSTDLIMPSSPPLMRNPGGVLNFGGSLGDNLWAQLDRAGTSAMEKGVLEALDAGVDDL
ncbi:hypothetical protein B0H67DRAFT_552660 [Lasiosphaeris hirsuta]|uniref:Ams2/SPT21 N-terminal domain-containing protein n=1 Tax=Lasiosphaeris hirsuta TaxID=260670 RepID=A0AA40AR63_9PEZI|nr:hypothetical protein B0H67DRAFT_552660 [Lasiosphaeris hirsuta]